MDFETPWISVFLVSMIVIFHINTSMWNWKMVKRVDGRSERQTGEREKERERERGREREIRNEIRHEITTSFKRANMGDSCG